MHITLSWLRLGDGSPAHGFHPSSLSIKKRGHSGACKPFQVRLTASITVGHATGREHVQVVFQQSKGRSESTDGIGSTPIPATQPHPLVRTGHTTSTSKGKQ